MKAEHTSFLEFVRTARQFIIPIYQRKYSWERAQCEKLWKDILHAGKSEYKGGHFVGSIVYVANSDANPSPLLVIDGQQRLTTLTLLIAALSKAVGKEVPLEDFSKEMLEDDYLKNAHKKGEGARKLILSETDAETLFAVLDGDNPPGNHAVRIIENHKFFEERLAAVKDLSVVCRGISKLFVVSIGLSQADDNPQLIFESMNSTGLELSKADLIRNFVLMGLDTDDQKRLYSKYWRPMEDAFGQEVHGRLFDRFMRHYLTLKTGSIPKIGDVYKAFKEFAQAERLDMEALIKGVHQYAKYYCAMARSAEDNQVLKLAFQDIQNLNVDVAYPLLLELYADYDQGNLQLEDFLKALRLIESYVFRRAVCAIPTNSLNKTFSTFAKTLKRERYLESMKEHFFLLPPYQRFPPNAEFTSKLKTRDLYNFGNRNYWLVRYENHGRKERVSREEYTIEHIMPQKLSPKWEKTLGESFEQIHQEYLHTLGNLTLTGYNTEYSNKPFAEKRDMEGGFAQSPLHVNRGLGQLDEWSKNTITKRAEELAQKAVEVWAYPDVSEEFRRSCKPNEKPGAMYTRENHPYLMKSPVREIFDAFRKEVLNLAGYISEEYMARYVSYRAETNFVDVIPQAKNLRLTLNMRFDEVSDPMGICEDITDKRSLGNGDVRLYLRKLEEVAYAVGLVKQSLEGQLGENIEG